MREAAAGLDDLVRAERPKHHRDDPAHHDVHHNEEATGLACAYVPQTVPRESGFAPLLTAVVCP
ncbi:hypothetical protein ACIBU0_07565 [Streptomyces sp. NPDC049627]|uniref:hypothetical protein n=1 Tax=Streptomyces sp. NPDC049627 TaxID=3365595 RepID=UPI003788E044